MDESLKALERKVELSPEDELLRWQLITALERAGDRRRSFLELARLARLGNQVATRRLRAWHEPRFGLGADPILRLGWIDGQLGWARGVGSVLVAVSETEPLLLGLDVSSLDVIWRARLSLADPDLFRTSWKRKLCALVGDDLVHVDADGLVLRDVATGEIRARGRLPHPCVAVEALNDRAVVTMDTGAAHRSSEEVSELSAFAIVDVGGELGRLIFRPDRSATLVELVSATCFDVFRAATSSREVRRLDDAAVLSNHEHAPEDRPIAVRNEALGAWGARHGWSRPRFGSLAYLGGDRVLLRVGIPPDLVAVTTRGEEVWRWRTKPGESVVCGTDATGRAGEDVIVFFCGDSEGRVSVIGLDATRGTTVFRTLVPGVDVRSLNCPPLAVSGGIVVVASSPPGDVPRTCVAVLSQRAG
ncbi:MAG TPA: hypothetical protein VFF73_03750 [Planctomycetota bacterium]|nr:hypothetical protein [Planctomycetota bacterium]